MVRSKQQLPDLVTEMDLLMHHFYSGSHRDLALSFTLFVTLSDESPSLIHNGINYNRKKFHGSCPTCESHESSINVLKANLLSKPSAF